MASVNASSAEYNFIKSQRAQQDILRDAQSKGPEIVAMLQLQPNMHVLGILGGGGYYFEILSEKLGKGAAFSFTTTKLICLGLKKS